MRSWGAQAAAEGPGEHTGAQDSVGAAEKFHVGQEGPGLAGESRPPARPRVACGPKGGQAGRAEPLGAVGRSPGRGFVRNVYRGSKKAFKGNRLPPASTPPARLRSVRRVPEASTLHRCGQGEPLRGEPPSLGGTSTTGCSLHRPPTATEASTARNERPREQLPACRVSGARAGQGGVTKDRGALAGLGSALRFTWGS